MEDYRYGYPELSEAGQIKTNEIIERFAKELYEVCNKTLYEFTCNIGNEIVDDDSWVNIREQTRYALQGYPAKGNYSSVDWKQVRKNIFEENREQIINDVILDKEREIEELKKQFERFSNNRF